MDDWQTCLRAPTCRLCEYLLEHCPDKIPTSGRYQARDGWSVMWDARCNICGLKCPPPDCGHPGTIQYYNADGEPQFHRSGKITAKILVHELSAFKREHSPKMAQLEMF